MSRRKRMMAELDQDIREHIERETQDNIERGMSPEEARYAAMRKFGNVTRVREETREVWSSAWFEQLIADVRLGLRMLRKSPGFAIVSILTLALGIGANTAIFSVVDAVLLKPLPYKDPARLLWTTLQFPKMDMHSSFVPHPTYFAWRDQNDVFSGIAATNLGRTFTLTGVGIPERIQGIGVSSNFLSVLRRRAGTWPKLYSRTGSARRSAWGHIELRTLAVALRGRSENPRTADYAR